MGEGGTTSARHTTPLILLLTGREQQGGGSRGGSLGERMVGQEDFSHASSVLPDPILFKSGEEEQRLVRWCSFRHISLWQALERSPNSHITGRYDTVQRNQPVPPPKLQIPALPTSGRPKGKECKCPRCWPWGGAGHTHCPPAVPPPSLRMSSSHVGQKTAPLSCFSSWLCALVRGIWFLLAPMQRSSQGKHW